MLFRSHKPKGSKMNTQAFAEYLSAGTLKSLTNRVESALEKDGTPAQLLRGASQSVTALIGKTTDETEKMLLSIFAEAFNTGAEIAKRGHEAKATTPKAPRENWHDADSAEAKEILAKKTAPKPAKKSRAILNEMSKAEMADLIAQLLNVAGK